MSRDFGRDLKLAIAKIVEDVADQAHDAALDVELTGIGAMRQRVETAVTPWGSARQAGLVAGPRGAGVSRESAGRRETDEMYSAITGETNRQGNRIVTQWGWQDPEAYYLYQEHGTNKIEPMEALHYSLHEAEDELTARLKRIK